MKEESIYILPIYLVISNGKVLGAFPTEGEAIVFCESIDEFGPTIQEILIHPEIDEESEP